MLGIDSFLLVPIVESPIVRFLSSIIDSPIVFLIVNGPIIDISIVRKQKK